MVEFNILSEAQKAKEIGEIRYLEFSFHDKINTFNKIIYYSNKQKF